MSAGKTLADLLRAETGMGMYSGTITATREDGMVNVTVRGMRYQGVPCNAAYTNRTKGDVVQVMLFSNTQFVVGKWGADSSAPNPNVLAADYSEYVADSYAYAGDARCQIGCSGDTGDAVPLATAWTYYDGTTNQLNAHAAVSGKTTASLLLTRLDDGSGDDNATAFQIVPHNYNTLPTVIAQPTGRFAPVTGLTGLYGTLEPGEAVFFTLPSDWFAAIAATTPTVKGVACIPLSQDTTAPTYAKLSAIAGGIVVA